MAEAIEHIAPSFSFAPFAEILQPHLEELLAERGLTKFRQGTVLVPKILIWLVLAMTIRRDLDYHKVFNWMLSGYRWLTGLLPPLGKIVSDGAISHARVKIGAEFFHRLFVKLMASFKEIAPDFHGRVSVAFDGATGTMPDSEANRQEYNKPTSGRGAAAFPQVRWVALLAVSARLVVDIAYGSYVGKGTGERALMSQILARLSHKLLLFLLDAGLYSLEMLWTIDHKQQEFLVKTPKTVKLKRFKTLSDGSYLAWLSGKIIDPDHPTREEGRRCWKQVNMLVRVIDYTIPGFRPGRLLTNILDTDITARELVGHYHQRWDIEISFDEIKTHLCATLSGQSPTIFRSKRPDLVAQELYAMLIMYNLVRLLIVQAAAAHHKNPRFISFLDALQHIIDAAPLLTAANSEQRQAQFNYLLALIADCDIDRPRRQRVNPRVVKVKMSKFRKKRETDKSVQRNLEQELEIIGEKPNPSTALAVKPKIPNPPDDFLALTIFALCIVMATCDASDMPP